MRCQRGYPSKVLAAFLCCSFSVAVVSTARSDSREPGDAHRKIPVTFSDLDALPSTDLTMDLSPNGRKLAYSLGNRTIWIVDTRSPRARYELGEGFMPKWSPKGDRLAYYAATADGVQLWIAYPGTGRKFQLTHVPGGIDPDPTTRISGAVYEAFRYSWSPDGERIAFASRIEVPYESAEPARLAWQTEDTEASSARPQVLTRSTPPEWTLRGIFVHPYSAGHLAESKDGRSFTAKSTDKNVVFVSQLFVADLRHRTTSRLTTEQVNYFHPDWSPSGDLIVCATAKSVGHVFGQDEIGLRLIHVPTGRQSSFAEGRGIRSQPMWSYDGKSVAYLERETFFGQPDVVSKAPGAEATNLTISLDRSVHTFAWAAESDALFITYKDGVSVPLARLDLRSSASKVLATSAKDEPLAVTAIGTSVSGVLVWKQSTGSQPGALHVRVGSSESQSLLVDFYPEVQQWALGTAEVVRWRNSRGDDLEGTVLKPPGYENGRRYPLIVDAYPLAGGTGWFHSLSGNHALAALGYVVFRPSPRAPHAWVNPWKGAEFSVAARGPDGWNLMMDDLMSGIDHLVRQGVIDPERMCLDGFSNGGGVVNYAVTRTDRFKCAVSVAGALADWIRPALLNTDRLGVMAEWAGGPELWQEPSRYIELSAVFHLNRVQTPMLLAAGDKDGEFLLNTVEMYNGLRNGVADVVFLRYPDQGHGFTGAALSDFIKRKVAFFAHHLNERGPSRERTERSGRPTESGA